MSTQHSGVAQVGARLESESLGLGPAGPCDPSLPGLSPLSAEDGETTICSRIT